MGGGSTLPNCAVYETPQPAPRQSTPIASRHGKPTNHFIMLVDLDFANAMLSSNEVTDYSLFFYNFIPLALWPDMRSNVKLILWLFIHKSMC